MAHLPTWMQPHTVAVETYLGTTGTGHTWAAAVQVRCMLDGKTKLYTAPDGTQALSAGTLYTSLANETLLPLKSRVGGRTVAQVNRHDDDGIGAWQHLEVVLA